MTRDFASKFQAFYQFLFSERVVRVRPTVLGASASSLVKTPEISSHYSVKNFRDLNSLSSCATNTVFRSHLRPRVRVVRSNNKRKEVNWHSSQSKSAYRSWNKKLLACLSCGFYKPAYSYRRPLSMHKFTHPISPSFSSYFHRLESQQGCVQCQDRVVPEEVKSALGVCTVFLLKKTVQWATSKEWKIFLVGQ